MCNPGNGPVHLSAKDAARKLAILMERQLSLSYPLDPVALRLFIRAYWDRVAPLAHAIHDEKD